MSLSSIVFVAPAFSVAEMPAAGPSTRFGRVLVVLTVPTFVPLTKTPMVRTPDGEVVGRLEQTGPRATSRRVVGADGGVVARLTAVWDVPGPRNHLPPGMVLLDRRSDATGAGPDADRADLLLGALVAADLLAPPPPPRDR